MLKYTKSAKRTFADTCLNVSNELTHLSPARFEGQVNGVSARGVEITGLGGQLSLGDRLVVGARGHSQILAEIVTIKGGIAQALVFGDKYGIGQQAIATFQVCGTSGLAVCDEWLGRVVDPLGRPLDGKGTLTVGARRRPLHSSAPEATTRGRLGAQLDFGVKALNLFTPCRIGQRLGLFSASGVGKSTLLAMLARNTVADVVVLALVGERGREVRDFLENEIGPGGASQTVVVVATSDAPPMLRREAAYAAMTIAEHFRDGGASVLLLMDSVTRFCLALREIALAAGEVPATRGYPPSVFGELPRLLERAGPGPDGLANIGSISAVFTVLVEGDDHDEPISDAVRGILDGHVIMDRRIGERGRYPAIDILRSLSRTASGCYTPLQAHLVGRARNIMSTYADIVDLVRLGAYRKGSDQRADEAIARFPSIESVLFQNAQDCYSISDSFVALANAIEENQG